MRIGRKKEKEDKLSVTVAKYSDPGGRSENEDSCDYTTDTYGNLCAVVADGLGGEGGGARASAAALDAVFECFRSHYAEQADDMQQWFEIANDRVLGLQTPECEMKTTLVVIQIMNDNARWAHIGDSRLYHFADGKYVSRTFDHSVSQMAVLRGEIDESDIRGHVDRNRLLKAVGRSEDILAECSEGIGFDDGLEHAFLLCTDGFWEYIYEEEMEKTLQKSDDAGSWLKSMVSILESRIPQDNDNNTAIALIINKKTRRLI